MINMYVHLAAPEPYTEPRAWIPMSACQPADLLYFCKDPLLQILFNFYICLRREFLLLSSSDNTDNTTIQVIGFKVHSLSFAAN